MVPADSQHCDVQVVHCESPEDSSVAAALGLLQ